MLWLYLPSLPSFSSVSCCGCLKWGEREKEGRRTMWGSLLPLLRKLLGCEVVGRFVVGVVAIACEGGGGLLHPTKIVCFSTFYLHVHPQAFTQAWKKRQAASARPFPFSLPTPHCRCSCCIALLHYTASMMVTMRERGEKKGRGGSSVLCL